MATAFMRWLETRPGYYDRGIRLLTLGRLEALQQKLVDQHIQPGMQVLEIGCGTGALTMKMALAGADVTAVDRSRPMLEQAFERFQDYELDSNVEWIHMDATGIGDRFDEDSFDAVVSSLAFSEMTPQVQHYVLVQSRRLVRPEGSLTILDEFKPDGWPARLLSMFARLPLRALTWLLTRTTTSPLKKFESRLETAGFSSDTTASTLAGTLKYIHARPSPATLNAEQNVAALARLRGGWSVKVVLTELWALFFRIVPPYPAQTPGVYSIGEPGPDAPLLVTGNYLLTVQRLVRAIDGKLDAWLLVADSDGINVWCAGGGGFLTAERILAALRVSNLEGVLKHRTMILPQLCANGVDGWRLREASGWQVRWGPIRASDIRAYLAAGMEKDEAMRTVTFPLARRLEMMAATLGFYALLILIPVAIFWRELLVPLALSLISISAFYAVVMNWLPGRDGLEKSVPLTAIVLTGLVAYSMLADQLSAQVLFSRAIGLIALSVFVGAELQGMSPEMRGEQANWGWEALIALCLAVVYWLVPLMAGWR